VEDKVLVIKRIHVNYKFEIDGADKDTVERVHSFHARKCPVARSIAPAIDVTTSYELL
jgi:uncharacterized OsmC-like protein